MKSSSLTIDVAGRAMPAYLAQPEEGSGSHPAVIVLQEIFGVNTEMKRITDLVASAGYVGLAINYYHRTDPDLNEPYDESGYKNGFIAAGKLTKAELREDVAAAIAWLDQQPFVRKGKIATWGFCLGGTVAFVTAPLPGLCGAISFYGTSIASALPNGEVEALVDADKIKIPLLLVFGGKDTSIPPESIERIDTALKAAAVHHRVQVYPNVGHAFFRHGSPAAISGQNNSSAEAVAESVADAWNLVQNFLKHVLH
ncbi:MAG: dienelactone hydrolase family protein [Candidatus Eremiobacteraeota bacterium]|nr:dienelactone hydrolase family protein [Candidatus Eremiobacteraeota bacterium]